MVASDTDQATVVTADTAVMVGAVMVHTFKLIVTNVTLH